MKFFLIFLGSLFIWACNTQQDPKILVLDAKDYKAAIDQKGVQLIDIRTPQEFNQGAITGALNVDFYSMYFLDNLKKLDKSKPVYIYCRTGSRSRVAAKKMIELGFTQVVDLMGGYVRY